MNTNLAVDILPQPTDTTCGPTSLHAVYKYYGETVPLQSVIDEVHYLEHGGTLAVFLAIHALKRGYRAKIFSYNLEVFDPTWLNHPEIDIRAKLEAQLQHKQHNHRLVKATEAYIQFLDLGGTLAYKELTPTLIKYYLNKHVPVLTGLSATYLYQYKREFCEGKSCMYDDVRGEPSGHFVVLSGYNVQGDEIIISDPYRDNPATKQNIYQVPMQRLINAILLGIVTYDANLLILKPKT